MTTVEISSKWENSTRGAYPELQVDEAATTILGSAVRETPRSASRALKAMAKPEAACDNRISLPRKSISGSDVKPTSASKLHANLMNTNKIYI